MATVRDMMPNKMNKNNKIFLMERSQSFSEEQRFILLSLNGWFHKETSEGWDWDFCKAQKTWDAMSKYGLIIFDRDYDYTRNVDNWVKIFLARNSKSLVQLLEAYSDIQNEYRDVRQENLLQVIKVKFPEYEECFDYFFLMESIDKALSWNRIHGFIPKNHILFERGPKQLGDKKIFRTCLNRFSKKYDKANAIHMALACSLSLNNGNMNTFFNVAGKQGHNDHDAVVILRCGATDGNAAIKLMKTGLSIQDILEKIRKDSALDGVEVQDEIFFKEAKKFVVRHDVYSSLERRWMERDTRCMLPAIEETYKGNRLFLMDKNDPRGLFLGEYTACCQHPDGAGEAAAWYGVERPNSGFYVVENSKGEIWAQAMAWIDETGKHLVLDSIESIRKDNPKSIEILFDLFKTLDQKAKDSGFIVTVGCLYGTEELNDKLYPIINSPNVPADLHYSDAGSIQLAFEKENGVNLDAFYSVFNLIGFCYEGNQTYALEEDDINGSKEHYLEEVIEHFCLRTTGDEIVIDQRFYATKNINLWNKKIRPIIREEYYVEREIALKLRDMGL